MNTWTEGLGISHIFTPTLVVGVRTRIKNSQAECPPQPITRVGVSVLSHFRQPHLNQGIVEYWPCLNIGRLSSLIPASARKPRCTGEPDFPTSGSRPLTVLEVGHTERVKLDLGRPFQKGISMKANLEPMKPEEGKGFLEHKKRGEKID